MSLINGSNMQQQASSVTGRSEDQHGSQGAQVPQEGLPAGAPNLYGAIRPKQMMKDTPRQNSNTFILRRPSFRQVEWNNPLLSKGPRQAVVYKTLVNADNLQHFEDNLLKATKQGKSYYIQQHDIQNNLYYHKLAHEKKELALLRQEHEEAHGIASVNQFWRHSSLGPSQSTGKGTAAGQSHRISNADSSDNLLAQRQAQPGVFSPIRFRDPAKFDVESERHAKDSQQPPLQPPFEKELLTERGILKNHFSMQPNYTATDKQKYFDKRRNTDKQLAPLNVPQENNKLNKTVRTFKTRTHQQMFVTPQKSQFERTIDNIQMAKYPEYNKMSRNFGPLSPFTSSLSNTDTQAERHSLGYAASQLVKGHSTYHASDKILASERKAPSQMYAHKEHMSLKIFHEKKLSQFKASGDKDWKQMNATLGILGADQSHRFRSISATDQYASFEKAMELAEKLPSRKTFQDDGGLDLQSVEIQQPISPQPISPKVIDAPVSAGSIRKEDTNEGADPPHYQSNVEIFNDYVDVKELINKKEAAGVPGKTYVTKRNKDMMTDDIRKQMDELERAMAGKIGVTLPEVTPWKKKKYTYQDFVAVEEKHEKEMTRRAEEHPVTETKHAPPPKQIHMLRRHSQSETAKKKTKSTPTWDEQQKPYNYYSPNHLPILDFPDSNLQGEALKETLVQRHRSPNMKQKFVQIQQRMEGRKGKQSLRQGVEAYYKYSKHIGLLRMKQENEERGLLNEQQDPVHEDEDTEDEEPDFAKGDRSSTRVRSGRQRQGTLGKNKKKAYAQDPDADSSDEPTALDIDDELEDMDQERQIKLGIFGLPKDLQKQILLKQRRSVMDRTNYLIKETGEQFIETLDRKIEEREEATKAIDPQFNDFVTNRLNTFLDLKGLQVDPKNKADSCIVCDVKLKIRNYLRDKEGRDKKFTKRPHQNRTLRRQLEYLDEDHQNGGLCTHFQSLDTIKSQEQMYLHAYRAFYESIRKQPIIGKRAVIDIIAQFFVHLEGLSVEERKVYRDRWYFKELLCSPWIRIVKDQQEEEIGADQYHDLRNPETDPVFAKITNLEVRKIVKGIYKLYLEAPDDEPIERSGRKIREPVQVFKSARTQIKDAEHDAKQIDFVRRELNNIFKETTLQKLMNRTGSNLATPKSVDIALQGVPIPKYDLETALNNTLEKQNFYSMNKRNVNSCHVGEINEETGQKNEAQLQFEYFQTQNNHVQKIPGLTHVRTVPGRPVPQTTLQNGRFELINYRSLTDQNFEALSEYLREKEIGQLHLEDSEIRDHQLRMILDSVLNDNYHSLSSFYYSKGDCGHKSIDALVQLIELQNVSAASRAGQNKMGASFGTTMFSNNSKANMMNQTIQSQFPVDQASNQPTAQPPAANTDKQPTEADVADSTALNVADNEGKPPSAARPPTNPTTSQKKSRPKPTKPIKHKLKIISLHDLKILPKDTISLFEKLRESSLTKLIELNLSGISLNHPTLVPSLCAFLQNQVSIIKLHLEDAYLNEPQMVEITDTIIEHEMCLTLQDINLSRNNCETNDARVVEVLEANLCRIIAGGDKLTHLNLASMHMPDHMNLKLCQMVAERPNPIQVFQISHNSTNVPPAGAENGYVFPTNDNLKEILKIFQIPMTQWNRYLNDGALVVQNKQKVYKKNDPNELIDFLVDQGHSHAQMQNRRMDHVRVDALNRNNLVITRDLQQTEQVFLNPSSCQEKGLKQLNHLRWKASLSNTKCEHYSRVVFLFDADRLDEPDCQWQEVPLDTELLQRIHASDHEYETPLICYNNVVSPMIHAQAFILFHFLNNELLYDANYQNRAEASNSIRLLQKAYFTMLKKRKIMNEGANKDDPKEQGQLRQLRETIFDAVRAINRACDGWGEYAELNVLDLNAAYCTQVVGHPPSAAVTERQPRTELQSVYMYSADIMPQNKATTFIVYDPKSDKMYQNISIVNVRTELQKQIKLKLQEKKEIKPVPRVDPRNSFDIFTLDRQEKHYYDIEKLLTRLDSSLGTLNDKTKEVITKFYPMLIDVYLHILVQVIRNDKKIRDRFNERLFFNDGYITEFNTMALKYANIEPIEEAEDSGAKTGEQKEQGASEGKAQRAAQPKKEESIQPHPYLRLHDSSKFLDFTSFIGSLAFLFKDKPEEMRSFFKDELLAIYNSHIKSRRDEILRDGELNASLNELKDQPLRYKMYIGQNLTGTLHLDYLKQILLDGSGGGLGLKSYNAGRRGSSKLNLDAVFMELVTLSKLRMTPQLDATTIRGYGLDFDEFVMFICQLALFMKKNDFSAKAQLEWSLADRFNWFVQRLSVIFKVPKAKAKKKNEDLDLDPTATPVRRADDAKEFSDSSDEDYS